MSPKCGVFDDGATVAVFFIPPSNNRLDEVRLHVQCYSNSRPTQSFLVYSFDSEVHAFLPVLRRTLRWFLFTCRRPASQPTIRNAGSSAARMGSDGRQANSRNPGSLSRFCIPFTELPIRPHVSALSRFLPGAGILVQSANRRGAFDHPVLISISEISEFRPAHRRRARIFLGGEWTAKFAPLRHAAALPESVAGDQRLDEGWRSARQRHRTIPRFRPYGACPANGARRAASLS